MKIEVDGFEFDFQDATDAFVFDEKDRSSSTYHGLSHAMKAVDLIVELENDYLFVEVKDFHAPDEYYDGNCFNHLREVLKQKYRDSFLYRWAEKKMDKPIRYLCLLTLDNALVSRMNKEIRLHIPCPETPTHCTGDKAIALFKKGYGENYIQMGAGKVLEISGQ